MSADSAGSSATTDAEPRNGTHHRRESSQQEESRTPISRWLTHLAALFFSWCAIVDAVAMLLQQGEAS
jgi:hypothetical protein